jgi:hypothetical protein
LTRTAPFFPSRLSTVAASPISAGHLGWGLIAGTVGLIAIIRILRRPTADWSHGVWSKVAWILVVLYVTVPLAGYALPLGAGAAIWRTRRPKTTGQPQLPFADGGTLEGK